MLYLANPKSLLLQLRPDLSPAEAAELCVGGLQRVPQEDLEQARVWLRYANAVYYLDAAVRAPRARHHACLTCVSGKPLAFLPG